MMMVRQSCSIRFLTFTQLNGSGGGSGGGAMVRGDEGEAAHSGRQPSTLLR